MPAYKDEQRGTWYAQFYYTDWQGIKHKTKKRGFKTQREAKEYEREFLLKQAGDPDMTFGTLVELYYEDFENRVRLSTIENKKNTINRFILPYFKNTKIIDIDVALIRRWQNEMLKLTKPKTGEPYSPTYLRSMNSQLSAILSFAVQYYNMPFNPCLRLKSIGKKQAGEMKFWTLDEFNQAIACEDKPAYHLAFMILFWCGLREGECLALKPSCIIHNKKALSITETFHKINGKEVFGPPKTDNSIRTVPLPDFVYQELVGYIDKVYGLKDNDRIFYFTKPGIIKELDYIAKKSGVEKIRIHDLRHSHVSLLIKLGYRTHAIADRIGDTPETVDRTYAHLYPDTADELARELEKHQFGFHSVEPQKSEIKTES